MLLNSYGVFIGILFVLRGDDIHPNPGLTFENKFLNSRESLPHWKNHCLTSPGSPRGFGNASQVRFGKIILGKV